MKRFLLSGIVVFAFGSAASAADIMEPIPEIAPPPIIEAAPFNWTGFYIGAHGGWGWGERDWDGEIDGDDIPDEFFEYDLEGPHAGAQIGGNFQWNWLVVGAEADVSVASMTDNLEEFGGLIEVDVETDWLATARGKLGIAWNRFMIYGTGGAAWAHVNTDVSLINFLQDSDEATHQGWVVGGGVEGMVNEHVSVKLEGLFMEFDEEEFNYFELFGGPCEFGGDGICGEADLDVVLVRAGINARF